MKNSLAAELTLIALGETFSESSLHAASNHPVCTHNDVQMLRRYWHGIQTSTDHVRLQELAIEINQFETERNKENDYSHNQ